MCIVECRPSDFACYSYCSREYQDNLTRCPCSNDCPFGCPCPLYQCPATTTSTTLMTTTTAPSYSSILVLNTWSSANVPLLIDIDGNVDNRLSFEIENEVYADRSCGVQFKGDFYVFGSRKGDQRQIAKVVNCELKRVGTLPFTFDVGACAATEDQLFLCFDLVRDGQTCDVTTEPTDQFARVSKSSFKHYKTRSAIQNSMLV